MTEPLSTPLRRWAPLAGLLLAIGAAYALGVTNYLSPSWLALKLDELQGFVSQHLWLSVLLYVLIYVFSVALSLPGASLLSLAGAVIFGWEISAPATVIGATIGSAIVFQIVKTSLGEGLARKAGPFTSRLAEGFKRDAFSYLLFLRLAPVFPFFAVNIVAGVFRVDLKTFVITTFLGIIPGTLAFSWLGSGAAELLITQAKEYRDCLASGDAASCHLKLSLSSFATPQLLGGLSLLAVIALIPIALRHLKGRDHV